MMQHSNRAFAAAIALSLGLGLSACGATGGATANRSLNSVHQPVVETATYSLDLTAGNGGMPLPEQRRLAAWFAAMEAGYGDQVSVDAPGLSDAVRADIAAILSRRGLQLADAAPVAPGAIASGSVRVTLTRASAHVPNCAGWAGRQGGNPGTATSANYGCAVNSNLAAMVADPRDLIKGATDTGITQVMTSNKAIAAYRERPVTGGEDLADIATSED